MKISYNWLKEYLDIDLEVEELSGILTDIGLEVEGLETFEEIKGGMKGLVVGEVLTCGKHPNADKLSVTTVDVGGVDPLHIVCGAPNVAAGQKVIVATIGAEMTIGDSSFVIKKTKLRGELSEGMICAEDEIGLGESHDGIMVLDADANVGTSAAEFFDIKTDIVIEIGLTPNRIDAGSHFGVARDLAAYLSQAHSVELKKPDISSFKVDSTDLTVPVELKDADACKRYTGLTITGLTIKESPDWMKLRLKAIGLNPINNVVDATNYVLHELGQPLHAFDIAKLNGPKVVVQKLPEGTPFKTLDEIDRKLSAEDLMICDATHPTCIGGVLGGMDSGVSETTSEIFLESAYFNPVSVRKSAKRHGINTDSSFRFERGVDPDNTIYALKRAALLIKEVAGGNISSEITDIYPEPIKPFDVSVNYSRVNKLIGKELDHQLIKNILTALDIEIAAEDAEGLQLKVPPYRVDVTREADIVEEVLRIYGYNNIDFSEKLNSSISYAEKPDNEEMVNKAADFLAAQGYLEAMSNSLTKGVYYEGLKTYPREACVEMLNPLSSDLNVMRQNLIFNGLETIAYNINRKSENLRIFEYGNCYQLKEQGEKSVVEGYMEDRRIGIFISGQKNKQSWAVSDEKTNFFQVKAVAEALLEKMGISISGLKIKSLEEKDDLYDGGLEYYDNKTLLLEVGVIAPSLLKSFDIEQEVFAAEIRWEEVLRRNNPVVEFKEMPKFPEVRRDLALLIDESVSFDQIKKLAEQTERKLLREVGLFDFYKGKNIPEGKKSYGVNLTLLDESKTLTDKEIDKVMNKITNRLQKELNAELR